MTASTQSTIGITLSHHIVSGVVRENRLVGEVLSFPPLDEEQDDALVELPREEIVRLMCEQVLTLTRGGVKPAAVGVALPGIIRNGLVEESPNLPQLKGAQFEKDLCSALLASGIQTTVKACNDADAVAAGLAAAHGKLDSMIRVWTLGTGIGFGHYPVMNGFWEGGHTVVSLDDKERFCGCGGRGHVEGIMGHRAMRLRFMDMEPEDVFEAAKNGDPRCLEFKRLWHKALAAATASSIHIAGPGKFFLTGYNVRFLDMNLLQDYVEQMVRMGPLQSFSLEIRSEDAQHEVVGSAVIAQKSLSA